MERLLFVSTCFLFPATTGGRIRTTQILRGMRGRRFEITLCSPAPPGAADRYRTELEGICDHFVPWDEPQRGRLFDLARLRHLASGLPIPVVTDRSRAGSTAVMAELARKPDVVVFDFPHSIVLAPPRLEVPSLLFTHNVESEIFRRQEQNASDPFRRAVWRSQLAKMERLERELLERFDTTVAVSARDAAQFREWSSSARIVEIPTGVDLSFFEYRDPGDSRQAVFTGSMDWLPNIDAMQYMIDEIWPHVTPRVPDARMKVIGRYPPASLVRRSAQVSGWELTGFVDDVRPHVAGASAYVIPLRVGGGTRLKAFEAMAQGCPMVSTTIGVEGLPVEPDVHYLRADEPREFAAQLVRLLEDPELRVRIARQARRHIEENFSCERAAHAFERACVDTAGLAV